jgi:hypothetical protein
VIVIIVKGLLLAVRVNVGLTRLVKSERALGVNYAGISRESLTPNDIVYVKGSLNKLLNTLTDLLVIGRSRAGANYKYRRYYKHEGKSNGYRLQYIFSRILHFKKKYNLSKKSKFSAVKENEPR